MAGSWMSEHQPGGDRHQRVEDDQAEGMQQSRAQFWVGEDFCVVGKPGPLARCCSCRRSFPSSSSAWSGNGSTPRTARSTAPCRLWGLRASPACGWAISPSPSPPSGWWAPGSAPACASCCCCLASARSAPPHRRRVRPEGVEIGGRALGGSRPPISMLVATSARTGAAPAPSAPTNGRGRECRPRW